MSWYFTDAFTGQRRSLARVRSATATGEVIAFSTLVLYEWLRGPRIEAERRGVEMFFDVDRLAPFGRLEAARAAAWFRVVARARQRQADLAIAACAVEAGAVLWTLNRGDFTDIPGLRLYGD